MIWLPVAWAFGAVLAFYPIAHYMAHNFLIGSEEPTAEDWAFGAFFGLFAGLLLPIAVVAGGVFLLSRALWMVAVGNDQPEREKIK